MLKLCRVRVFVLVVSVIATPNRLVIPSNTSLCRRLFNEAHHTPTRGSLWCQDHSRKAVCVIFLEEHVCQCEAVGSAMWCLPGCQVSNSLAHWVTRAFLIGSEKTFTKCYRRPTNICGKELHPRCCQSPIQGSPLHRHVQHHVYNLHFLCILQAHRQAPWNPLNASVWSW